MMSKFSRDMRYVEGEIGEYLKKQDLNNFVKPDEFCISLNKGIDREVIAYYKGKGWKYVKGEQNDFLKFM